MMISISVTKNAVEEDESRKDGKKSWENNGK